MRALRQISASLRRRIEQQALILRAIRKRVELTAITDRTAGIAPGDILVFATIRNEAAGLPAFLAHYRGQGVRHFLIVDNDSGDGSGDYLRGQGDVSLWWTAASYRQARFGMDWICGLLRRFGHGRWCLTVDADELLVYPHCDTRPLTALTDWLDDAGRQSFPAMLLDLYRRDAADRRPGTPFLDAGRWFDPANYIINRDPHYANLWIQGGPRARSFFQDQPLAAPALNKLPLVRWHRSYAYVSSTHMLLPRRLNMVYCRQGGEMESGCLLHGKLLSDWAGKSAEEQRRCQHYAAGREYAAYLAQAQGAGIWSPQSREYADWRQLEDLGLISRGGWA